MRQTPEADNNSMPLGADDSKACSQGTSESLAKRGRLFHQAELSNRGRRVRVWLTRLVVFFPCASPLASMAWFLQFHIGPLEEARWCWYDVAIMISRTQITLESEIQRRARQRASELGVSLAEYVRRLVARDLARPEAAIEVDRIFDLGKSGGADIAREKDSMIAEAFRSKQKKTQRR